MPQYTHRGYTISISTSNVGGRVRVHTAIFTRLATPNRVDDKLRAGTTRFVATGPLDLILRSALNSAKLTADVLAASAAAPVHGGAGNSFCAPSSWNSFHQTSSGQLSRKSDADGRPALIIARVDRQLRAVTLSDLAHDRKTET